MTDEATLDDLRRLIAYRRAMISSDCLDQAQLQRQQSRLNQHIREAKQLMTRRPDLWRSL